jgi:hypothetical protein
VSRGDLNPPVSSRNNGSSTATGEGLAAVSVTNAFPRRPRADSIRILSKPEGKFDMEKTIGSARWMARLAAVAAVMSLAACGGGGGDGGSAPAQGTLQVSLTDAPACYKQVLVTVTKVQVQKSGNAADSEQGWTDIVPPKGPTQIDLLALTNGTITDLGAATVDATTYSQMRLVLKDNTAADPYANSIKLNDGTVVALKTPSGQTSGLKIKGDFNVAANSTTQMLLDFDACKSIVVAGNSGQYLLKPVVRLSERFAGSVSGYVTTTMAVSSTVSAQQNGEVIRSTRPDSTGKFNLSYLPTGTYTLVISADSHATGVVESVPVGTSTTVINGTATAIVLPTATMGTVTGTVTASSKSGNTTTAAPVTDATVAALQSTGTTRFEVNSANVDGVSGVYTLSLPASAPVRATWAGTPISSTSFISAGTAGYTLRSMSATAGTKEVPATVTGGSTTTVNIAY